MWLIVYAMSSAETSRCERISSRPAKRASRGARAGAVTAKVRPLPAEGWRAVGAGMRAVRCGAIVALAAIFAFTVGGAVAAHSIDSGAPPRVECNPCPLTRTVVDKPAWDETVSVVDRPAWDETVTVV